MRLKWNLFFVFFVLLLGEYDKGNAAKQKTFMKAIYDARDPESESYSQRAKEKLQNCMLTVKKFSKQN